MFRRFMQLSCLLLVLLGLSACNLTVTEKNELTPEDKCIAMKRQMVFNKSDHNTTAKWRAKSKRDELEDAYYDFNCDEILA